MKTFLSIFLLVFLTAESIYTQNIEDCRTDYEVLKKPVFLEPEHIVPDKAIYLSTSYARTLKEGIYDKRPSRLIYHEYVRPASKKELKSGKIENGSREQIGDDGKIYVPKTSSGRYHFFKATSIFKGSYRPSWREPNLVVPMGLEPFDVLPYADQEFWVVEKKSDYLLLEVNKHQLVYFVGYPPMTEVFDTGESRDQLELKRQQAQAFLDKPLFLQKGKRPRYRSEQEVTAPRDLFDFSPLKELMFEQVAVSQENVWLKTAFDSLGIDEGSEFLLLDKSCVMGQQLSYAEMLMDDFERENDLLNQSLKTLSSSTWTEDPWVRQTLLRRFWLLPSKRKGSQYKYVLLGEGQAPAFESYLYANIDEEGNTCLTSHLSLSKGIYHNRILVYLGNRRDSLESSRISNRDKRSRRTYTKNQVIEEIDFNGESDEKLLSIIARNTHRKIRIRFQAGGKYHEDIILDQFYKEQIRDVYMLSQLIKQTGFALSGDDK